MKRIIAVLALTLATATLASGAAEAKGCFKGAVVGAIAGHLAHHHAVLGAIGGCLVGRHLAHEHERDVQSHNAPAGHH